MNMGQSKLSTNVSFNSFHGPLRSELLRCHLRKLRLEEGEVPTVPRCVRNRVGFLATSRARVFPGHARRHPVR